MDGLLGAISESSNNGWILEEVLKLEVWLFFWNRSLVLFGQDIDAAIWSRSKSLIFGKVKHRLGQDLEVEFWSRSLAPSCQILKLNLDQLVIWPKSSYFGESSQPWVLLPLAMYKDSFENPPILALWLSTCQIRREKDERCASNACSYVQPTK